MVGAFWLPDPPPELLPELLPEPLPEFPLELEPVPDPVPLEINALASTWAACCCGLPLTRVRLAGVTRSVSWSSRLRLLALVSANLDDSATWPLTVAPASLSPVLMPFTTLADAPGVVTITTFLPF